MTDASTSPDVEVIEYEMGYGADEFGNVLQGPFSGERSIYRCETIARHHWRINQIDAPNLLEIRVQEMPARRLGLFALPVLQVRFYPQQADAELQGKFFTRFHQYFHKGGG
ncbi:MAG: hypothetical protein ACC663_03435 [Gammaproteobacteria bacterium]